MRYLSVEWKRLDCLLFFGTFFEIWFLVEKKWCVVLWGWFIVYNFAGILAALVEIYCGIKKMSAFITMMEFIVYQQFSYTNRTAEIALGAIFCCISNSHQKNIMKHQIL